VIAGLPRPIAGRELATVREILGWGPDEVETVELLEAYGPGNIVTLEVESEQITEVFAGVGRRGVRAEAVAADAADSCKRYLAAPDVPIGDCLADQLLLPMALAGGGSYKTLALTRHSATNIDVIRMFLDVEVEARDAGPDVTTVHVRS
jgi:RNA 3'-terminal phosphate cyclase (ATP)